jgi:hypothetical protein
MPVLSDEDWDRILDNVSITTFMQGLSCGLKYYNNYVIVTSTNNEISVTPNEIYYVPRQTTDNGTAVSESSFNKIEFSTTELAGSPTIQTAHRIDCEDLTDAVYYTSFKSKEIKYDKIYNKNLSTYEYDHMVYTDYGCIVDSNYKVTGFKDDGAQNGEVDGNTNTNETSVIKWLINGTKSGNTISGIYSKTNMQNRLKAYRIAVAKEKNNLYKSIAFSENYGYVFLNGSQTINSATAEINLHTFDNSYSSTNYPKVNEIEKIEITLEDTNAISGVYTVRMKVSLNGSQTYSTMQTVSTTSKSTTTFEYKQDFTNTSELSNIKLYFYKSDGTTAQNVKTTIKSIKIYYK